MSQQFKKYNHIMLLLQTVRVALFWEGPHMQGWCKQGSETNHYYETNTHWESKLLSMYFLCQLLEVEIFSKMPAIFLTEKRD